MGLCILYRNYHEGGKAPPVTAMQNTQTHSEFLTTSTPKQKPRLHENYLSPLINYPQSTPLSVQNKKIFTSIDFLYKSNLGMILSVFAETARKSNNSGQTFQKKTSKNLII